jgi:hypothetical protein
LKLGRWVWFSGVGLEANIGKTLRKNADQYKTSSVAIAAEQKFGVLVLSDLSQ